MNHTPALTHRSSAMRARVRSVGLAAVGASVGAALATSMGVPNIAPILLGSAVPLLAVGPRRARTGDDWLRRGTLALAAAVLAHVTFLATFGAVPVAAWAAATFGMLVALGLGNVADWRARLYDVTVRTAGVALGFVTAWLVVEGLYRHSYGWADALGPALFGGLTVLGAVAGDAYGTLLTQRRPPAAHLESKPALFEAELDGVGRAAERVRERLAALDTGGAGDAALSGHVLAAVDAIVDDAQAAVARWRMGGVEGGVTRQIEMRRRCRELERQRDGASDERVVAEAARTLAAQQRAVVALERIEAGRHAFGLRLSQARAQLELLDVNIQHAVTAGRRLDMDEVEGAVELLEQAQAFLDAPDGAEPWFANAPSIAALEPAAAPMPA